MMFNKKNIVEPTPQTLEITAAGDAVVDYMIQKANPAWTSLFEQAKSGVQGAKQKCLGIITTILSEEKITVSGFTPENAAEEIFCHHFGLRELDEYYRDNDIDEIRVSPNGKVFLVRRGKLVTTDLQYSEQDVENLIDRLKPVSDVGISLDEGNASMELVRPDGSRLTALCRPVTLARCFALRKHGNIPLELKTFIERETFDGQVGQILRLLVKGRRNILVCGGVNSGKTTLLKYLASELDPHLSVRVLDTDNELRLSELLPDRDIWELEAHPEIGSDMKTLFTKILRITPDVIIVPEFRGYGEVWTTIEACTRGHDGSMATAHFSSFSSPAEAVRNTAMLAVKEDSHLPLEMVIERVAQAFQIIIQTFADTRKGIRKVTAITEVVVENGQISYNPLVVWEPYTEDFTGDGEWRIVNPPSMKCALNMRIYGVSLNDIREVFGGIADV